MKENFQRILVIRQGGIGDTVLLLPVIQTLRENFPSAYLEGMGYPERMVLGQPPLDKVSSFDQPDLEQYLSGFDLIMTYLSSPLVFRGNPGGIIKGKVIFQNCTPDDKKHIIDYLLEPLEKEGLEVETRIQGIFLTPEETEWAKNWWREQGLSGEKVLAIHPGAGSSKKCWGEGKLTKWTELTKLTRCKTIIIVGPAEKERWGKGWEKNFPESILVEEMNLRKLGTLLKKCALYLGNDSGITHLAAAVGVPVIALFGPTDPQVWGPRGKKVQILQGENGGFVSPEEILKEIYVDGFACPSK